jgi:hypothetical protein
MEDPHLDNLTSEKMIELMIRHDGRGEREPEKVLPTKDRRTLCQVFRPIPCVYWGVGIVAALALASLITNKWFDGLVRRGTLVTNFDAAVSVGASTRKRDAAVSLEKADLFDSESPTGRITFICDMACEMGNMLSHLAYCVALGLWLERDHGVTSKLVLRHNGKEGTRWESSRDDIVACFPRLSGTDFSLARTQQFEDEFERSLVEQKRSGLILRGINHDNLSIVERVLTDVARRAKIGVIRPDSPNGSITLPFLAAKRMLSLNGGVLLDRYYDEIRQLYSFDDSDGSSCCALRADRDETVFVRTGGWNSMLSSSVSPCAASHATVDTFEFYHLLSVTH